MVGGWFQRDAGRYSARCPVRCIASACAVDFPGLSRPAFSCAWQLGMVFSPVFNALLGRGGAYSLQ